MTVGNVEIVAFSDDTYFIGLNILFPGVPLEAWNPYRERYANIFRENDWHVNAGCYLLRSDGQTIMVDTGVGPATAGIATFLKTSGRLPEKLDTAGVRPDHVDTVVFTHLHPDHTGWNTTNGDGEPSLRFPRARHFVNKADWEAFHTKEVQERYPFAPTYVQDLIDPIEKHGKLELVTGDLNVTPEITAIHTPGHTPGHMSILISSGGEKAVITGDVVVHPAQISEPDWPFGGDQDGETGRKTRNALLERVEAEGIKLVSGHFPEPGFGQIIRLEGRRYWQAL
jgi:glyoxylase-like metal-dependent hydrolase (beta-lactamase superfamily II)